MGLDQPLVGQLARKGISVKYNSDLASRSDLITWLKAEQEHVDILTGLLFSNFVDTEHFRSSHINEYYGPVANFTS